MAQDMIKVERDCLLPKDGLLKIHLGFDFSGMGWFFEKSGGGNIPEVAEFMLAHQLRKYPNFKQVFFKIAQYMSHMAEPDMMWMRVYGDDVKFKAAAMTIAQILPQYYGLCFVDHLGVALGFGICIRPGKFGFEGHFLENGDPHTSVVNIYGGMAHEGKIYTHNLDGNPLKINGKQTFDYQIDEAMKIDLVEEI